MTATTQSGSQPRNHALHIGIAEEGKQHAVAGNHTEALRHYREALKLANAARAPEVFFRHYTQCVLESLEHTGSHGEVIGFCENALAHFDQVETPLTMHKRDHAEMLERYAVNLVKAGRTAEAKAPLANACAMVEADRIPVARALNDWLRRGMTPQTRRLAELQTRHGYFTVTHDQIDPRRAIPLPAQTGAPAL